MISFVHSYVPNSVSLPESEFLSRPKTIIFTNSFQVNQNDLTLFNEKDRELVSKNYSIASLIHTTIFQVFGFPFGKIFKKTKSGNYNFDTELTNPFTNQKISQFYTPESNFASVFGELSQVFEFLKAEIISLLLSVNSSVLSLFSDQNFDENQLISVVWLLTAKSFLRSLRFFNPHNMAWENDQQRAKFILGMHLFQSKFFSFESNQDESVTCKIDFDLISNQAQNCLNQFLFHLLLFRSTGDLENAKVFLSDFDSVPQDLVVLSQKSFPKRMFSPMFVQPNILFSEKDQKTNFVYKSYPPTNQGVIESFADRFKN